MERTIEIIKTFFKNNNWKYSYDEEDKVFKLGVNMGNILGNVQLYIFLEESSYNVLTILNSKCEEKDYPVVAEFLHRANYGLKDGNFEIDYEDGEIRYKSFVNFKNVELSQEIVEQSITIGVTMINRYGKGLLKLMLGEESAKRCVEYCEDIKNE